MAAIALLLPGVLAGCFGDQARETSGYTWGLGLDLEGPLPEPGPFREEREEIDYWMEVVDALFERHKGRCAERPHTTGHLPDPVVARILSAEGSCLIDQGAVSTATDQVEAGNSTVLLEWRQEAEASLRKTEARIASGLGPANLSSVQVAAMLMRLHLSNEELFEGAVMARNTNLMLAHYHVIIRSSAVLHDLALALPAPSVHCVDPSNALASELRDRIQRVRADERMNTHRNLTANLRTELQGSAGRIDRAEELGWWPYLQGVLSTSATWAAFLDRLDDAALPTYPEAIRLWYSMAAKERSIWTDGALELRYPQRDTWGADPYGPETAMRLQALDAMEWRFSLELCSPGEA